VELIPAGEKISTGGIHIPETAKKKYIRKGTVLAVARDCAKPELVPGLVVYAVWNCGNEVFIGAQNETRLIKSEDVWAMEKVKGK
jgi:co-chaperonin GroES (HSP10)